MKNILVTGGAGFIGSNLVRFILNERKDVKIVNLDKLTYAGNLESLKDVEKNPNYTFIKGDICDEKLIESIFNDYEIDSVMHLAAESHVDRSIIDPKEFVVTNVVGTLTLLEEAKKYWSRKEGESIFEGKRFLHVSTDEVFGSLGKVGLFTEKTAYSPNSPYSASKAGSDHLVRAYIETYKFPAVITNCSNNYGPYQFPEKLIPLVIVNALEGKKIPLYGDGKNIRDWLYVKDHCRALLTVIEKGILGETYNIGGNNEIENIEIVNTICGLLDELAPNREYKYSSLIEFVKDRLGHDKRYAIDASKIKEELGFEPSHNFKEGIRETVNWYLNNKDWLNHVIDGNYRAYYKENYS